MTQLLERAFAEAAKLTDAEQDAFAAILLEELANEQQWDASFVKSQDKLAKLAEAALAEHLNRETKSLDINKL